MHIKNTIDNIHTIFEKNVTGEEKKNFAKYKKIKGAGEKQITSLEKENDIHFPGDFKDYYKLKNGSGQFYLLHIIIQKDSYSTFKLLSLDDIKKRKASFHQHQEEVIGTESEKIDSRIKPYYFSKKWIPFAESVDGSMHLVMDFDPAEEGKIGQILCCVHNPNFAYYIGLSFTKLFEDSINYLELLWSNKK